jgi:hypothetical protein
VGRAARLPRVSDANSGRVIRSIDDEHEPVGVIAVLDADVDAGIGEVPREEPELPGQILVQVDHDHIADDDRADAVLQQRIASTVRVRDEEVGDRGCAARTTEDSTTFKTDARCTKDLREVGVRAGSVVERHLDVTQHDRGHASVTVASIVISLDSEFAM